VQPVWYFGAVFLLGTLPWTGAMLLALVRPGFAWRGGEGGFSAERFLWVAALVVFVFFSLGDSKLAPYLLPMLPPVAVLAGRRLAAAGDPLLPLAALASAAGLAALAWLAPRYASDPVTHAGVLAARGWFYAAAAAMALAAGLALRARPRQWLRLGGVALLTLLAFQLIASGTYRVSEPWRSSRNLAEAILADHPGDATVYAVGDYYPQALPFYLGRTVQLVGITGELQMGIDEEPQRWIATLDEFARRWIAGPRGYAVFNASSYDWARQHGLPMRELARNARLVLVSRQ
jgi:4-amino-4-deoxy-L-arabinose transferase-like glycosyltransferase